jgi:hypothetical protein
MCEHEPKERFPLLAGLAAGQRVEQLGRVDGQPQGGCEEVLLAREVVQHGGRVDAGPRRDRSDRRSLVAPLGEEG